MNVLTGKPLAQQPVEPQSRDPQFSPDGKFLAVEEEAKILLFDVAEGAP